MVFRLLFAPLFVLFLMGPVTADEAYEALFVDLANAENQAEARQISDAIWLVWLKAPDAAAQEVLDAAMVRREAYDYRGAIEELNRLIKEFPDYAEGWNQRATMYYLVGNFEASLKDVEETLIREPRHFGALAGKSVILFNQGKTALAQLAVTEALKFHPFLNERFILQANPGKDI